MTAQIPDRLILKTTEYDVIGARGEGLFSPEEVGLHPFPMHTACYRGYYATYLVEEAQLFLTKLTLKLAEAEDYEPIQNVEPELDTTRLPSGERVVRKGEYTDLKLPVPFTGNLLLGGDFIQKLYVHMGFQRPYAYKEVLEVVFEDGQLRETTDHSTAMADLREKVGQDSHSSPTAWDGPEEWRKSPFSAIYDK